MNSIDSCLIIKDELNNIKILLNQLIKFSTTVHLVDTGSTDGTLEYINEYIKFHPNVKVYHFDWINNFSAARNFSFSKSNSEYTFWCDADDQLTDKLIEELINFSKSEVTAPDLIMIPYQYRLDDPNKFNLIRLVRTNRNYKWKGYIHEYIEYTKYDELSSNYFSPESYIIHHRSKVHGTRNLDIFKQMEQDNELKSTRDSFYYAQELFTNHRYYLAYLSYCECALSDNSYWVDRVNAVIKCYQISTIIDFKFKYSPKYLIELLLDKKLIRADLYCVLGDIYASDSKFFTALDCYNQALKVGQPDPSSNFLYDDRYHKEYPITKCANIFKLLSMNSQVEKCESLLKSIK